MGTNFKKSVKDFFMLENMLIILVCFVWFIVAINVPWKSLFKQPPGMPMSSCKRKQVSCKDTKIAPNADNDVPAIKQQISPIC